MANIIEQVETERRNTMANIQHNVFLCPAWIHQYFLKTRLSFAILNVLISCAQTQFMFSSLCPPAFTVTKDKMEVITNCKTFANCRKHQKRKNFNVYTVTPASTSLIKVFILPTINMPVVPFRKRQVTIDMKVYAVPHMLRLTDYASWEPNPRLNTLQSSLDLKIANCPYSPMYNLEWLVRPSSNPKIPEYM